METEFKNGRVIVKVGDITKETTNAIVNAANKTLLGGGGVDRAIHRVGGKQILDECKNIRKTNYPNGLPPGEAIITSGGNLRTRFVIHTVGPIFGQENGEEERLLANSYRNSLSLAVENEIKTIAWILEEMESNLAYRKQVYQSVKKIIRLKLCLGLLSL